MFSEDASRNDDRFFELGGVPIVTEMKYLERAVILLMAETDGTLSSSSEYTNGDDNDATAVLRPSHVSATQYFALHRILLEGTESYFNRKKLMIFGNSSSLGWEDFQRQYSIDKGRIMHRVRGCGNKQILPIEFWYNAAVNLSKQEECTDVSFHRMVQLMDQKYVIDKAFLRDALTFNDGKKVVWIAEPTIICNLMAVALTLLAVAICSTNPDCLGWGSLSLA